MSSCTKGEQARHDNMLMFSMKSQKRMRILGTNDRVMCRVRLVKYEIAEEGREDLQRL